MHWGFSEGKGRRKKRNAIRGTRDDVVVQGWVLISISDQVTYFYVISLDDPFKLVQQIGI